MPENERDRLLVAPSGFLSGIHKLQLVNVLILCCLISIPIISADRHTAVSKYKEVNS